MAIDLSETEAATVARFEAAPAAEEALIERMARAIHDADVVGNYPFYAWADDAEENREDYRLLARAAVAVARGER